MVFTVASEAGSIVLLSREGDKTSVYNLHDTRYGAVRFEPLVLTMKCEMHNKGSLKVR